ncbi:MAG: hypothetical protein LBU37_06065, partial [Tannerellaceae bacterium]|nr:hypothetical protein [Tannerellaceae bacterium]
MDTQCIIKENNRRHEQVNKPYNPVTGEGCHGKRVCLKVEDAPFPVMYLPDEMMKTEYCIQLQKYGSIKKLYEANNIYPDKDEYESFWISFCELRYIYDYEFYAYKCQTIRDKLTAMEIPFKLNRGQRIVLKKFEERRRGKRPVRARITKCRQWGCTTFVQNYMNWIQTIHKRNWNSVICAHVKDGSITARSMLERTIKNMPPIGNILFSIKNYQNTQNIKEIPERGCTITIGTAIEPDSVRSQDVKMAHFTEEAYYPNTEANNPALLETSIIAAIPPDPDTLIVCESTPNGLDYFYEQYELAKAGETSYDAIFVEWWLIDIYSVPFNGTYYNRYGKEIEGTIGDFIKTLNEYEINLFNNYPECTLENINWRRVKRADMPSEAKMMQDFPSNDIEAFQESGLPAFRAEDVEALRKDCRIPVAVGEIAGDCLPALSKLDPKRRKEILQNIRFEEDKGAIEDMNSDQKRKALVERNKLKIWEYPDTSIRVSERYIVIFDPQKGLSESADWGVITVIDRYWMMYKGVPEVVAEWRGRIDKDIAIWVAAQVARYYNDALLVIESNTYDSDIKTDESELIFDTLAEHYSNLYSRTPTDKIREGLPLKYGFHTNKSTKTMIIANYVALLREKGYKERSNDALNEARVYEQKKNGSYGAKEG